MSASRRKSLYHKLYQRGYLDFHFHDGILHDVCAICMPTNPVLVPPSGFKKRAKWSTPTVFCLVINTCDLHPPAVFPHRCPITSSLHHIKHPFHQCHITILPHDIITILPHDITTLFLAAVLLHHHISNPISSTSSP